MYPLEEYAGFGSERSTVEGVANKSCADGWCTCARVANVVSAVTPGTDWAGKLGAAASTGEWGICCGDG